MRQEVVNMDNMVLEWLERNREYGLLLIPLFAFAESCIGIGLIVSGAILVVVATVLIGADAATIAQIVPLAFAGALLGDHVGYYTGRWLGPGFHQTRLAARYRQSLERAETMIRRRGAWAIFIGRFIPAIRSLVPPMLGISGFPLLRYSLYDMMACLMWALALGLILAGTSALV
jgi:membrane-associated protein